MRLNESVQEDVISYFKEILDKYYELKDLCSDLADASESDKDINYQTEYLYDFVKEELWSKIKATKEEILDVYYPIDYADDEDDADKAGERYRDSKEKREKIFDD